MIKSWPIVDREAIGDYRIFSLRKDTSRSPKTGNTHDFFVVESPDWINVVPITPDGQVILIRQYRHGTEEVTIEIPGGMVDLTDSSPAESARRELLEETGYVAGELVLIGSVAPNPAFLNNRCYTYLALDARRVGEPQLDGTEDIEFELVPAAKLPELVVTGKITHSLVIAAFYFYEQYRRNGATSSS
jgi:8-oxo-dGTP pyrophosphatase MutT (NUDIX family)